MSIFLIRHGETAENRKQVVQAADVPLSAIGQEQAALLAARLTSANITHILSSDFPRAQQTAHQLALATGAALTLKPILQERNFGDLRGQSYHSIGLDFFAEGYLPPNGESWDEFNARVAEAWQTLVAAAANIQGNLAVVTHGLVCRAVVKNHLTMPKGMSLPDKWSNTSVTEFEQSPPYRILRLNNAEHLDAMANNTGASAQV